MDTRPNKRAIHTLFVTALQAEARPLIEHHRLKAVRTRAFRFYQSTNVSLIVCGIGETAAASATAFGLGFLPENCIAINLGIAGSDNAVGSLFQASCISRENSGGKSSPDDESFSIKQRCFYPHLPFKSEIPKLRVMTLDNPRTDYMEDCCFEMEAYGFCFAARQFLAAEQVHCLKIVSDNPTAPLTDGESIASSKKLFQPDAAAVSDLVHARMDTVNDFKKQLANACQKSVATTSGDDSEQALTDYISRIESGNNIQMHFTQSQRLHLLRLTHRYTALGKALPLQLPPNLHPANTMDFLNLLESSLAGYLPGYATSASRTKGSTDNMNDACKRESGDGRQ